MLKRLTRACALAAIGIAASGPLMPALAEEPGVPLADYILTSWTVKDGLPSNVIWSMTQDAEGYLWLGTNGGLVRFDGDRFVTVEAVGGTPLPKAPVRTVHAARDGSLWAGFTEGSGASRIQAGHAQNFGERDGLNGPLTTAIIDDRDGTIWAGTGNGLYRFVSGHFQETGPSEGLPKARVDGLYVDTRGSLLVGTSAGIFRRPVGSSAFEQVDSIDDVAPTFRGFTEDPVGRLWVTDYVVGFRRLGAARLLRQGTERGRGNRLLMDRQGDMWLATMGEGIWRIHLEHAGDRFSIEKARVSGARTIFEDRTGNIWTAAGDGLIRLTKPKFAPVTNIGLVEAVEPAADGGIWVATADDVRHLSSDHQPARQPLVRGVSVRAVRTDAEGRLWVATNQGLLRYQGGRRRRMITSSGQTLTRINALTADSAGGIWISDRDKGLYRWNGHGATLEPVPELAKTFATAMHLDRSGRIWLSSTAGRLVLVETNGQVKTYGPQDGLGAAPYNAMYEDHAHIVWIGGSNGLSALVQGRFIKIEWRGSVNAIEEDQDGNLWLASGAGIVRMSRSDLTQAMAVRSYEVHPEVFDATDGLAGMPISFGSQGIARANNGSLWFVTGRGLTIVDPRRFTRVDDPGRVRIDEVFADDRPVAVGAGVPLPPGTVRVEINYGSLQLDALHKVRFRYRLDGLDADWINAGTSRRAVYTNLPPRTYRFQVSESKSDGSWRDAGATWDFSVRPMFYQTARFFLWCAALAGVATWAAWRVHVRRMRRQFALLIEERARLSRELHDTLLQSLVGVSLQFDAIANSLAPASPARHELRRIRRQVQEYIRDARHSIWNLRLPVFQDRDLSTVLRETTDRLVANHPLQAEVLVQGTPRRCGVDTEAHLLRIGQEAVLNAVRHAGATRIQVALTYRPSAVTLSVSDDGRGFDQGASAEREGHYGLVSMHERAEQMGARLALVSRPGAGTSIEVVVSTSLEAQDVA